MTNQVDHPGSPKTLYKYFSPERASVLENMELRFSRPSEFNDTFDSHYLIPTSQGSSGIAARFRFKSQVGVLCLTERPDNHLMWVNYAKSHTGFVLGFDAGSSFFSGDGRILDKVTYQRLPKVLPEADIKACFYKSKEWEYEKEWRCVRRFEPNERRVVAIDPSLITQIIFGSRMETWQVARIAQYAEAYEMTAQFMLSYPSPKSWMFQNKPKKVAVCSRCHGEGYLMDDLMGGE